MIHTSHDIERRNTRSVGAETYDNLVADLADTFRSSGFCHSALVHGSYAKKDLVAGWSDLDIVVFLDDLSQSKALREQVQRLSQVCDVPVRPVFIDAIATKNYGRLDNLPRAFQIDCMDVGELICGAPLPQSHELDVFSTKSLVDESRQRTARVLDEWNFRIRHLFREKPASFVYDSSKVVLQVLMYSETSTWSKDRTRDGYLNSYKSVNPSDEFLDLFKLALNVRKNWFQFRSGAAVLQAQEELFWGLRKMVSLRDLKPSRIGGHDDAGRV